MIKHGVSHAFLALTATVIGDQIVKEVKGFIVQSMGFLVVQYPEQYQSLVLWLNKTPYSQLVLILLIGFIWGVFFKWLDSKS